MHRVDHGLSGDVRICGCAYVLWENGEYAIVVGCHSHSNFPIRIGMKGVDDDARTVQVRASQQASQHKVHFFFGFYFPEGLPEKKMLYDRFIPVRSAMDLDVAHMMLLSDPTDDTFTLFTPYASHLADYMIGADRRYILPFHPHKQGKTSCGDCQRARWVPRSPFTPSLDPERILDAPDLTKSSYLKLIDWGCDNIIAVALGCSVYSWNAQTHEVEKLADFSSQVTAVSWMPDGTRLAIGMASGVMCLWDCRHQIELYRTLSLPSRVSTLAWNNRRVLSASDCSGEIAVHDPRANLSLPMAGHRTGMCSLAPCGHALASGGRDGLLNIWDLRSNRIPAVQHRNAAEVKSLAWCPWKRNLLASGSGYIDGTIRMWHGDHLSDVIATFSDVNGIGWNSSRQELVSIHGMPTPCIALWNCNNLKKVKDNRLRQDATTMLSMTQSPDQTTVAVISENETIQFFKIAPIRKEPSLAASDSFLSSIHIR